jgi:hypothetical protein
MIEDDAVDLNELDQHTLREVKRFVESYSLVTSDETYHEIDNNRRGKRDAYTNIAAVISE